MLHIPPSSGSVISVVGIDPGSTTLGTGILWVDLADMRVIASSAKTYHADKLFKDSWTEKIHGGRMARIWGLENELVNLFQHVQPYLIASESPFISKRFPQAGLALTEVVCSIRNAVMRYDPWKPLCVIDPPSVKNAVGAAGNADKEAVKRALIKLPDLNYSGDVPLETLDEHSIDSLAVAYGSWRNHLKELQNV